MSSFGLFREQLIRLTLSGLDIPTPYAQVVNRLYLSGLSLEMYIYHSQNKTFWVRLPQFYFRLSQPPSDCVYVFHS